MWWRCGQCSGEFRAAVFHRTRGLARCPRCSGRTIYRDLAAESPEVAAWWHPDLNGTLTPDQVRACANTKVWWICTKGHASWQAEVSHVFLRLRSCPRCNVRVGVSRQETELFAELQHVLTGGEQQYPFRAPHRTYRLDMVFPADAGHMAAIEFDGSYWHRDNEEADRRKAEQVEEHGQDWTVIRVREEPLEPIRPSDVTVPLLADPFTAASIVLAHLATRIPWPLTTLDRLHAYTAGGRRKAQALAEQLIAERQDHREETPLPPQRPALVVRDAVQQPLW